jgi:hypothetical protein
VVHEQGTDLLLKEFDGARVRLHGISSKDWYGCSRNKRKNEDQSVDSGNTRPWWLGELCVEDLLGAMMKDNWKRSKGLKQERKHPQMSVLPADDITVRGPL